MMISTYLNRIDVGILESYPLDLFGSFCSNAHLSQRQGSCKDLQGMFVFWQVGHLSFSPICRRSKLISVHASLLGLDIALAKVAKMFSVQGRSMVRLKWRCFCSQKTRSKKIQYQEASGMDWIDLLPGWL